MKFSSALPAPLAELDATDRSLLELLQENCKQPLASIGSKVGLSAPSVVERIHKLEEAGVITGYVAMIDAKRLGKDVTAFIGVSIDRTHAIGRLETLIVAIGDVLECHHVTGAHTLMVKAKTRNTQALDELIDRIRSLDGVTRTETTVVLSTAVERSVVALDPADEFAAPPTRPNRRSGGQRSRRNSK